MRILLIEDDDLLAAGVLAGLRAHGMTVDHVARAAQARAALACTAWDALVLDLGLPDQDGLALLDGLRQAGCATPVLILSARDQVSDRVGGLRCGADDYLLKPFDLSELAARLHALIRRAAGRCSDLIERGSLRVDTGTGAVSVGGRAVALSRRELALVRALLDARGRILSVEQLKHCLYDFRDDIESNAVNVHIHHLRRKLGSELIETVRGLGFRLAEPWR